MLDNNFIYFFLLFQVRSRTSVRCAVKRSANRPIWLRTVGSIQGSNRSRATCVAEPSNARWTSADTRRPSTPSCALSHRVARRWGRHLHRHRHRPQPVYRPRRHPRTLSPDTNGSSTGSKLQKRKTQTQNTPWEVQLSSARERPTMRLVSRYPLLLEAFVVSWPKRSQGVDF